MPGYVGKLRQRFNHKSPNAPQHSPYKAAAKGIGAGVQNTVPDDESAKLSEKQINIVQQIVGVCMYYGRVIDETILPALSEIASKQAVAT